MTTAKAVSARLGPLIDRGFDTLIETLISGLAAKEIDGKPATTAKQLTDALEAAVKWQEAKWRQSQEGAGEWGTALGGRRAG